jgi:hypothetical protein
MLKTNKELIKAFEAVMSDLPSAVNDAKQKALFEDLKTEMRIKNMIFTALNFDHSNN